MNREKDAILDTVIDSHFGKSNTIDSFIKGIKWVAVFVKFGVYELGGGHTYGKVLPQAVPAPVFQTISILPSFHSSSGPASCLSPRSSFTFYTNT